MRDAFVGILVSQIGQHEGHDTIGGWNWNNIQPYSPQTPGLEWSQGQPYCATGEAWGAYQAGFQDHWPITASCAEAVKWWQDQGRWTQWPVLGGPFYLGTRGEVHTGVVTGYDADYIYTVEFNTNDSGAAQGDGEYALRRRRRGVGSPYGYGVPAYPEGTISADPQLGGTPSAQVGPGRPVVSLSRIIAAQKADSAGPQGSALYRPGGALVEAALARDGLLASQWVDGSLGTRTRTAVQALQERYGFRGADADGIFGRTSLTRLGQKYGFDVSD